MSHFLHFGKSKLLLPIFLALIIAATLQAILIISISSNSIQALKNQINESFESSRLSITSEIESADSQIEELNNAMVKRANTLMRSELAQKFEAEQVFLSGVLDKTLRSSANVMTNLFSELAPHSTGTTIFPN